MEIYWPTTEHVIFLLGLSWLQQRVCYGSPSSMSWPRLQTMDRASPSWVSGVGHLRGEVGCQSPSPCFSARPLC